MKVKDLDGSKVTPSISQKAKELEEFAKKHNLVINPKYTTRYWANLVLTLGHCPCKRDRKNCPCDEALKEIEEKGKCTCDFFRKP